MSFINKLRTPPSFEYKYSVFISFMGREKELYSRAASLFCRRNRRMPLALDVVFRACIGVIITEGI
jgi:hypothetical protein